MEAVFGILLTEVYCHHHKDERLDPTYIVGRAKMAMKKTPIAGTLATIEVHSSYICPHLFLCLLLTSLLLQREGQREMLFILSDHYERLIPASLVLYL